MGNISFLFHVSFSVVLVVTVKEEVLITYTKLPEQKRHEVLIKQLSEPVLATYSIRKTSK